MTLQFTQVLLELRLGTDRTFEMLNVKFASSFIGLLRHKRAILNFAHFATYECCISTRVVHPYMCILYVLFMLR